MQLNLSNTKNKIKDEVIENFETNYLGKKLPKQYTEFVRKYNSGYVRSPRNLVFNIYDKKREKKINQSSPRLFFAIDEGDYIDSTTTIKWNMDVYKNRIPSSFLPVAMDPGGNIICLGIEKDVFGEVFYWDHENENSVDKNTSLQKNMWFLSENFEKFIKGMYILNQESWPIMEMIDSNNLEELKSFLKAGGDTNTKTETRQTLLQRSVLRGNVEMVKFLLEKDADHSYCLVLAGGNIEIAQMLLDKGADINERDDAEESVVDSGETPLTAAIRNADISFIEYLLKNGADPKKPTKNGWTPQELAKVKPNAKEIINLLEKYY